MDYIDKIEIKINDFVNKMELFIVPNTLRVYVKENVKSINKDELDRLLRIICKWNHQYIDKRIIDAQMFRIRIYTNNGVDEYFGSGVYPDNYSEFLELVRGIYG